MGECVPCTLLESIRSFTWFKSDLVNTNPTFKRTHGKRLKYIKSAKHRQTNLASSGFFSKSPRRHLRIRVFFPISTSPCARREMLVHKKWETGGRDSIPNFLHLLRADVVHGHNQDFGELLHEFLEKITDLLLRSQLYLQTDKILRLPRTPIDLDHFCMI